MARTATTRLDSKTARLKLAPRPLPYFTQVSPSLTVGYRRMEQGAGQWVARELVDPARHAFRQKRIGLADDYALADGVSILSFPQARAIVASGQCFDTQASAPSDRGKVTVADAAASYLGMIEAAKGESARYDAAWRIKKHIAPKLGTVKLHKLTSAHISKWRDGLVKRNADPDAERASRDSANRNFSILKALLNHAYALDMIEHDSSWRKVKSFRAAGASRKDHFDAEQVQRLIDCAREFDAPFAALLIAGFLTGARLGELTALDVHHFDSKRGMLSIPSGKTGARACTLTGDATRFFASLARGRLPTAPLLVREDGERWGKSEQFRRMRRALSAAGLPPSASFYSLRHSYISRAIESGVPLTVICENVGTSLRMIEKNYAHVLSHVRRDLLERASPALRLVVNK